MNQQDTSEVIEVPVLIVGGGPSGLTASLLLSRYGIRNLLVNKYRWTANSPRAHITNQRTMEVFRDAGVEAQVVAAASPHALMANNVWATSFSGQELGRLLTWGNAIERKSDYEDDYLASDTVFGVKESLILDYTLIESGETKWQANFDFIMVRE